MEEASGLASAGIAAINVIFFSFALAVGVYIAWNYLLFDFRSRFLLIAGVMLTEFLAVGLIFHMAGIL